MKKSRYWTKYEYSWALIFTLLFILWAVLEEELGWHEVKSFEYHFYLTYLFIIPAFGCFLLFFYDKKSHRYRKRFKFEHAFKSGLVLSFLIAVFNIPIQYLVHFMVSPGYLDTYKSFLDEKDILSLEQTSFINLNNSLWFFPLALFVLGIIFTLIYAIFIRKGKHEYTVGYKK